MTKLANSAFSKLGSCFRYMQIVMVNFAFLLGGCAGTNNQYQATMADVIVATKDALTTAQEKLLFEELVKYKELGSTFSLYVVKSSVIEVDAATSNTVSSQSNANVQFSLPIPVQIVNQRISMLDNSETEKLTVSLVPLGKDLYNKVKSLFDLPPGKEPLYGLIYFAENGQPIEADGSPIKIPEASAKCSRASI